LKKKKNKYNKIGGDMMQKFESFYKREKKKKKKGKDNKQVFSDSPTYTMPEVISKKRKDY